MAKIKTSLLIATALIVLAGCAPKHRELPPQPLGTGGSTASGSVPQGPIPGSQEDFVASVAADRVFFDTDKYDIDGEDQATLASQAKWLARYPQTRITIEGHCDERGTEEYNRTLGEKRAQALREYLVRLGVSADRIRTISYGEDKPAVQGHDDAAWSKNRRGEFVVLKPKN